MKVVDAIKQDTTAFPYSIKDPTKVKSILKSAKGNSKLGNGKDIIQKGPWKGMPMYSLTLTERETCPKDCFRYSTCYGNKMMYSHRIDHTNIMFRACLDMELNTLNKEHTDGFVVRLHVLGDFYSPEYVLFWGHALDLYPNLHIFGYTARTPDTYIGSLIENLNNCQSDRCIIRFSTNKEYNGVSLAVNEAYTGDSITCPEQLGKVDSCIKCGLCLNPNFKANIKFLEH